MSLRNKRGKGLKKPDLLWISSSDTVSPKRWNTHLRSDALMYPFLKYKNQSWSVDIKSERLGMESCSLARNSNLLFPIEHWKGKHQVVLCRLRVCTRFAYDLNELFKFQTLISVRETGHLSSSLKRLCLSRRLRWTAGSGWLSVCTRC